VGAVESFPSRGLVYKVVFCLASSYEDESHSRYEYEFPLSSKFLCSGLEAISWLKRHLGAQCSDQCFLVSILKQVGIVPESATSHLLDDDLAMLLGKLASLLMRDAHEKVASGLAKAGKHFFFISDKGKGKGKGKGGQHAWRVERKMTFNMELSSARVAYPWTDRQVSTFQLHMDMT